MIATVTAVSVPQVRPGLPTRIQVFLSQRRSSFDAARREEARRLYECFVKKTRTAGLRYETGEFQAIMEVELVNSGPVTILLDSEKLF